MPADCDAVGGQITFQRSGILLVPDLLIFLIGIHEVDLRLFVFAKGVPELCKEGENEKEERGADADECVGDIPKNAQKEGGDHAQGGKNTKNHLKNLSHFENFHV